MNSRRSKEILPQTPVSIWMFLSVVFAGFVACAEPGALNFNGLDQYAEVKSVIAPPSVESSPIKALRRGLRTEIYVDSTDGTVERTGDWSEVADAKALGLSLLKSRSAQSATLTWHAELPREGYFTLHVRLANLMDLGQLTAKAIYRVKHADGITVIPVNQASARTEWLELGAFRFAAVPEEGVTLVAGTDGLTTLGDGIRFAQAPFDLATRFTVEAWARFEDVTLKWNPIVTKGAAWGLSLFDDTGKVTFFTGEGSGINHLISREPLEPGIWYHIAGVCDGTSKHLFISAAGSSEPPSQFTAPITAPCPSSDEPLRFGRNDSGIGTKIFLKGMIDEVRVWSIPLGTEELTARRNASLRGSEPGLLGDWTFDDPSSSMGANRALVDAGNDPMLADIHGATWTSAAEAAKSPPIDGELAIESRFGAPAYVRVDGSKAKGFGAGPFAVESWVWIDPEIKGNQPPGRMTLVSQGENAWVLGLDAARRPRFSIRTVGGVMETSARTALPSGEWHHVAAVLDVDAGSTGKRTATLYVDGLSVDSKSDTVEIQADDTSPVLFGAKALPGSAAGEFFIGRLDEVRLWNKAPTPRWIRQHYQQILLGGVGLVGVWRFNEGGGDAVMNSVPSYPFPVGKLVGAGDLSRVDGILLNPEEAGARQYALYFNGTNTFARIDNAPDLQLKDLTIEAWVKPEAPGTLRTILMKGDIGYGLFLDVENRLRFSSGLDPSEALQSDAVVPPDGQWHHVAVVVDSSAKTTAFYIDGRWVHTVQVARVQNNSGPLILGKFGLSVNGGYFKGYLDEVRLWNVARSAAQIASLASSPLPNDREPGLVAYYNFDEGAGTVLADTAQFADNHRGYLSTRDASANWTFGREAETPLAAGIRFQRNPAAVGLWAGTVTLNRVTEVATATPSHPGEQTPTADTASFRILLHVDANGTVRLLKDVILMAATEADSAVDLGNTNTLTQIATNSSTRIVLVTDDSLIPKFNGLISRGGRKVGIRMGTVGYDFDGNELELGGGIGPNHACSGRIQLGRKHPTNPFRHRYHPDHANFDRRNDPADPAYDPSAPVKGIEITRTVLIHFNPPGTLSDNGTEKLDGTYGETISGLHKTSIQLTGTLELARVSTKEKLNVP